MNFDLSALLDRAPAKVDLAALRASVTGRRVLVTGAGGSIGSELCRQIVRFDPAALLMVDRHENSLHDVLLSVEGSVARPFLGDVLDPRRLQRAFAAGRPEVVFHAAAHKHVPLTELHAAEAVRNNVIGTRAVASEAGRNAAERFVLVSSDKAVNPSSVMGATKRAAELVLGTVGAHYPNTSFITVRFGNVLGSNGSVVPRFADQIRRGGPVTVTDPEVQRFFMLIPEAVQLMIEAAAIGRSGETFVLDMGAPIRIVDLAARMMQLAGANVGIRFVGLRPGEKIGEELVGAGECAEATGLPHLRRIRRTAVAAPSQEAMATLEALAREDDDDAVLAQLLHVVPTFTAATRCA